MIMFLLLVTVFLVIPYLRLERNVHYIASISLLLLGVVLSGSLLLALVLFIIISGYFLVYQGQQIVFIEKYLWNFAKKSMPKMNDLEKQALKAGEKSMESLFFEPARHHVDEAKEQLGRLQKPLEKEAQDFLDGPVQQVLDLCDDFKINHVDYDLPEAVWTFLKDNKFFGLMIDKQYGGLGFNNTAHARILSKLSSKSLTLASVVAVPNSLGPAELIAHYGTQEQKDLYLRDLATGVHIPCFGLTSTKAGSDAQSIEDYATVVRYTDKDGEEKLGLKLNFSKRYITLAPVATLVGLAVKIFDPDLLYFDKEEVGITVLLLPADTPGIVRGGRHYPSSLVFLNGPISGQDIIVSLDSIIGGADNAGCGWAMLVECLTCGRAISLPSAAIGSAWSGVLEALLYTELRYQFSRPISNFDAVQERIFEAYMWTSALDHMRLGAISLIDDGLKPGVLSGAVKYFTTENCRIIACHVIDVMAGKAVMMGPKNTVISSYHGSPVGITVEGANILTRGLMVYGQGILRSHPFLGDIAFAIDDDKADVFSKKVWEFIVSSYRNVVSLIFSSWQNIFKLSPSVSVIMGTRFRLLSDLLLAYYAGELKKKGQLCGYMADLLSLQFCYLACDAREQEQLTKETSLDFLAYQFCQTELALVQRLPCSLRFAYKFIQIIAPFQKSYPVSKMRQSLEVVEKQMLDPDNALLHDIDQNHPNINLSLEVYREYLLLEKELREYWSIKQKTPYLSVEQIGESLSWDKELIKKIDHYLYLLENVVSVDVFKDLKKKKVMS